MCVPKDSLPTTVQVKELLSPNDGGEDWRVICTVTASFIGKSAGINKLLTANSLNKYIGARMSCLCQVIRSLLLISIKEVFSLEGNIKFIEVIYIALIGNINSKN